MVKIILGFLIAIFCFILRFTNTVPFEAKNPPYLLILENVVNRSSCTAFFAKTKSTSKAYILTAGHCVLNSDAHVITKHNGARFIAKVLDTKFDFKNIDWAILSIPDNVVADDPLIINADFSLPAFTWYVSMYGIQPIYIPIEANKWLVISGNIIAGESGSPVIWHNHSVIGIISSRFIGMALGLASSIKQIPKEFLR